MQKSESKLCFDFSESYAVTKFDDTPYYRNAFNVMPGSKAVDFIAVNEDFFILIEVKNCTGHELDNLWRIAPNNLNQDIRPESTNTDDRDSLDIEVAQKVAMTCAALTGVYSGPLPKRRAGELLSFAESLYDASLREEKRKIIVVLLLEGQFNHCTRDGQTVRQRLKLSLDKKLKWLNSVNYVCDTAGLLGLPININVTPENEE